jgi:plastocyanin/mono/diheme cytochrome c family protein
LNTAKQINVMIGLLFVGLLGTLFYFLFDNGFNAFGIDFEGRENAAIVRQEKTNVERGAALFALNCRACHGLTGAGSLERAGLPGAALNRDDNRPPELTAAQVDAKADRFQVTIHCGRVGTLMPPWSTEEDGPLNEFQIEQLVMLITSEFSPEGWEFAVEEANHSDLFDPEKFLEEGVNANGTTLRLNDASGLENVESLRIGGDTIDEPYEVLKVVSADPENGTVEVVRGAEESTPLAHEADAIVYNGPIVPPEGPIVGEEGTPPCGQANARPQATAGPPVEISGDVTLEMADNFFDLDGSVNPNFAIAAGDTVAFTLPNAGGNFHNLRLAGPDGEYNTDDDTVSDPDAIPGGDEGTLEFEAGEAGTFPYQCDFHPTEMLGEITVAE